MDAVVGQGKHIYRVDENWAKAPVSIEMKPAAVAVDSKDRVLVLDYEDFCADPSLALERLLSHSGLPRSRADCRLALDAVWAERGDFRFNRGVSGRGAHRFTPAQVDRLRRYLSYYPDLAAIADRLIPPPSASWLVRGP